MQQPLRPIAASNRGILMAPPATDDSRPPGCAPHSAPVAACTASCAHPPAPSKPQAGPQNGRGKVATMLPSGVGEALAHDTLPDTAHPESHMHRHACCQQLTPTCRAWSHVDLQRTMLSAALHARRRVPVGHLVQQPAAVQLYRHQRRVVYCRAAYWQSMHITREYSDWILVQYSTVLATNSRKQRR
jgi:hypothetical protein